MAVEVLIGQTYRPLPDCEVRRITQNAWEVVVQRSPRVLKLLKGRDPEVALDGACLVVEDRETEPCVLSAADKHSVTLSAWAL